ncbi:MAG: hypothetical protein RLZZ74_1198 [Cyanobacteriota bacterium]|jgi:hypothetical protein
MLKELIVTMMIRIGNMVLFKRTAKHAMLHFIPNQKLVSLRTINLAM